MSYRPFRDLSPTEQAEEYRQYRQTIVQMAPRVAKRAIQQHGKTQQGFAEARKAIKPITHPNS